MRAIPKLSVLACALVLLPGCNREATPVAAAHEPAVATTPAEAPQPFMRSGENLTVHVNAMPLQDFLVRLGEQTGVKITAPTDSNPAITVQAEDASLRKVLGMALADQPYSATLYYTNLQDSLPSLVTVMPYRNGAAQPPAGMPGNHQAAVGTPDVDNAYVDSSAYAAPEPAQVPEPVSAEPATEEPDFEHMAPEAREPYFLSKPTDEQVALIFDMEPSAADARLMTSLMAKPDLELEVKLEMLDSLSNADYEESLPALKVALDAGNNEVKTKAIEVLGSLGSEKDIPTLQQIADEHQGEDDEIGQAARDAIDSLKP